MDMKQWPGRIKSSISQYKYVLLVVIVGILLMAIPSPKEDISLVAEETREEAEAEPLLSDQLEQILSGIYGAGKVKVMLSEAQGARTIYQTDTTHSQTENDVDSRTQTILITDSGKNQMGLIHQINPPIYQGAIILSEGADDPTVRLAIVDAVSKITGLGADKISVLKMK